ncbi:DUF11 domain-containing protein [Deinococcus sp. RM]|uniref:DUF11 domain-containing protein n=1 Tax=Deinococcus sp. RM TaxID=2316359 RepID=UPI000E6A8D4E|nr:DUF11 domain-containing protein [Deinococcus sp. RM]RIY04242.1 DUF11 domain-containing protein [Deinococcus sp. RM]
MKRLLPLTTLSVLLIAAGTPAGQVIENTATYEDTDGRLNSNTVRVTVQPVCAAELTPDTATRAVRPGETVTVPYVLRNTGNDTHTFPLTLQGISDTTTGAVSADLNGNGQNDDAPASAVTLAPDQQVTLFVTSTVTTSGTRTLTLISGCEGDLKATLTLGARHQPPLITKVVDGAATIEEGQPVTYTIRVTNPEAVPMPDVTLEDILSSALSFVSVAPDEQVTATPTEDGRTRVTWRTNLGPNETRTYTLTARVKSGTDDDTEVSNTASATNEGGTATSTPPAVIRVFTSQILIQKTVAPLVVDAGGLITYSLTVTNPSTTAITDTYVTDSPDAQLTVYPDTVKVNGKSVPTTFQDGKLRIPVGTMRSNESVLITYDARVPVNPAADRPIRNRAVASARGRQGTIVANITSNLVAADITVRRKLGFTGQDLIGRVYVDRNANNRFDAGDTPVAGARVLLAGGREALTDSNGLYAFANVPAGMHAARLDTRSVPFSPAGTDALNRLWNPGTAVTNVVALTSQDFPLRAPRLTVQGANTWSTGRASVTFTPPTFSARALTSQPVCIRLGTQTLTLTMTPTTGILPSGALPTPEEVTCQ